MSGKQFVIQGRLLGPPVSDRPPSAHEEEEEEKRMGKHTFSAAEIGSTDAVQWLTHAACQESNPYLCSVGAKP